MGITGAPFGRIGMKICRATPPSRAFARGKGFRVPGDWGVGKKLKNVSFSGHFFLNFWKGMKKFDEIGQIRSDWADIDPERFPASSFRLLGGFWPIFPKNREKNKIRMFRKIQIFRIFRGNPQTNGWAPCFNRFQPLLFVSFEDSTIDHFPSLRPVIQMY